MLIGKNTSVSVMPEVNLSPVNSYRLLPSPLVTPKPFFIGREDYLNKLHKLISDGNRVIFLYGIGGIGKTEIAKQYALAHKDLYDVIIYTTYEENLLKLIINDSSFELIPSVNRLLINNSLETDEEFFARKLSIIKKVSTEKTLIIVDNFNVEDDKDLDSFIDGRYQIIFTTRFDYSTRYVSMKIREIENEDDLINIFMKNYMGYMVEKDDPDLLELIRMVGCHTYTIELLAHHMENSGQTAKEMIDSLKRIGILSFKEDSFENGFNDPFYNLLAMFRISDFPEPSCRILQYLSLMPLSGVPAKDFIKWAGCPASKALLNLEHRGWIIRGQRGIALHPIVQTVIQYVLPVTSKQAKPLLDHVAETIRSDNSWHFTKIQKEQYALIARSIFNYFKEINDDTLFFYRSAAGLFSYTEYAVNAIDIGKRVFDYCVEANGLNSFETAEAVYRIGWTYLFNPHLDNAIDNAIQWLTKGRRIFESISIDTIDKKAMFCGLLENLSKAYSMQYDHTSNVSFLSDAEKYAEQSVALAREWLTDYTDHKKTPAGSLLRLSDICITMKKYDKAEALIDEAYEILSSIYGINGDPDVLRATSRKARVMFLTGRYRESLAETEKNLQIYRDFYGDGNPSQLNQLILKIRICIRLGLTEDAVQAQQQAIRIGQKIYSADSSLLEYIRNLPDYENTSN